MDDALASLTPQQRETIADIERRYRGGQLPIKLTRIVRNEYNQVRVAYKSWYLGAYRGEMSTIVYTGGETNYGGLLSAMGDIETLYEWPEEAS